VGLAATVEIGVELGAWAALPHPATHTTTKAAEINQNEPVTAERGCHRASTHCTLTAL
jgi:hypothetical protein